MNSNILAILTVVAVLGLASPASSEGVLLFDAMLSGAQEVPATDTIATGKIRARFNAGLSQVEVDLQVEGLTGVFTAAHFHCARPGVNGPIVFGLVSPGPLMFDGKRVRGTLTNDDFTGADCTSGIGRPVNNLAALAFAMRDGLIYANSTRPYSRVARFAASSLRRGRKNGPR